MCMSHFCITFKFNQNNILQKFSFKLILQYYFCFSSDLDKSTSYPMFDLNGVRTHDFQIMTVHFHVTKTLALTTRPSVADHAENSSILNSSMIE